MGLPGLWPFPAPSRPLQALLSGELSSRAAVSRGQKWGPLSFHGKRPGGHSNRDRRPRGHIPPSRGSCEGPEGGASHPRPLPAPTLPGPAEGGRGSGKGGPTRAEGQRGATQLPELQGGGVRTHGWPEQSTARTLGFSVPEPMSWAQGRTEGTEGQAGPGHPRGRATSHVPALVVGGLSSAQEKAPIQRPYAEPAPPQAPPPAPPQPRPAL